MKKEDLLRYTGSIQQIANVRSITFNEGRSKGMKAIQVRNGPLQFTCMEDKCLDIAECIYKGTQINFLSKPGLNGRNHFDTNGAEAQRSIMGGLFFTCGLENICAPYTDENGKQYPMHGRMRTTPAEHVSSDAFWSGEEYVIRVSGEMREAELFGENLVLRRNIETTYGKTEIRICDEVTNEGFRDEPMMLMYHINFGYPFLKEGCRVVLPTMKVTPREETSALHADTWDVMAAPKDNEDEYVFLHELAYDSCGNTFAAVVNDEFQMAFRIGFNKNEFPYFMQWKSTASGDYVIGLEPSNSSVYGRGYHEKQSTLHYIGSQQKEKKSLTFSILEGAEAIRTLEDEKEKLINQAT
ncbi:MAG: aldose 1-epimerase family protein [Oscillospiraceae bacterium]|nr:aldose 1-epimerase family protein [Oscillospiraceae bacterium]